MQYKRTFKRIQGFSDSGGQWTDVLTVLGRCGRDSLGRWGPLFFSQRQPIYVRTQLRFWAMFEKSCSPGIAESEVLLGRQRGQKTNLIF